MPSSQDARGLEAAAVDLQNRVLELSRENHDLREALRDLADEFEAYAGQDAPLSGYYRQAKAVLG